MFISRFPGSRPGAIEKALNVCNAVADGDFEARITMLDEDPAFKELFLAINRLVDRTDAYIRESRASLDYVAENKYYRRIQEKGMAGTFGTASRSINAATAAMQQRVEAFSGQVTDFEAAIKESIGAVSSASTELEASAKSMDGTALRTSEQATVVAVAAEKAAANVQTVASAAQELSASVHEISNQVVRSTEMPARYSARPSAKRGAVAGHYAE